LNHGVESQLPAGTVTFLFTDIEGSTQLIRQLGDSYGDVLDEHRRILREQLNGASGQEIDTQGEAFFFSFTRAREAVRGAVAAQRALSRHEWRTEADVRVRMGLHTGEPAVGAEGYHGIDVVRAARICSAGGGGQILLSETTRTLIGNDVPDGAEIVDLGSHDLKDLGDERLFQLALADAPDRLPVLKPTQTPNRSQADLLGEEFSQRIQRFVDQQLERTFSATSEPQPRRNAQQVPIPSIIAATFGGLALLVLVIKFAFFKSIERERERHEGLLGQVLQ
jgi:class 3 adenylate cyclase